MIRTCGAKGLPLSFPVSLRSVGMKLAATVALVRAATAAGPEPLPVPKPSALADCFLTRVDRLDVADSAAIPPVTDVGTAGAAI